MYYDRAEALLTAVGSDAQFVHIARTALNQDGGAELERALLAGELDEVRKRTCRNASPFQIPTRPH
jgi:hypothetical protein